jgi:hypothetical protein
VVVSEERNEAGAIELAGYYTMVFGTVAEGEGYEVTLEIVVAAYRTV